MEELDDLFHLLNMDSQESECFTENGSNILELNFDAQQVSFFVKIFYDFVSIQYIPRNTTMVQTLITLK